MLVCTGLQVPGVYSLLHFIFGFSCPLWVSIYISIYLYIPIDLFRRRRHDAGSLMDICAFLERPGVRPELWTW